MMIVALLAALAGLLYPEVRMLLIPRTKIDADAERLVRAHGDAALAVAKKKEVDAWLCQGRFEQGRWRRVCRTLKNLGK